MSTQTPSTLFQRSFCILFTSPAHPGGTTGKMTFLGKQIYQTNKNFRMCIFISLLLYRVLCKQNIVYFKHSFIVS